MVAMNLSLMANTIFGFNIPINSLFTYGAGVLIGLVALPSVISILKQRHILGFIILLLLAGLALGVETFAIKTGFPYGHYAYDTVLGTKVFDTVPWTIGVAYPILVLAAFWLASKITTRLFRPVLTGIITGLSTVVLDPVAVKLQLWKWDNPGPFFGVPYAHLIGWLVIGLIGGWIVEIFWGSKGARRGLAYSGAIMIWFWTGASLGTKQWIPAGVGVFFSLVMFITMVGEKRSQRRPKHSRFIPNGKPETL